jgi:hypothetical protein
MRVTDGPYIEACSGPPETVTTPGGVCGGRGREVMTNTWRFCHGQSSACPGPSFHVSAEARSLPREADFASHWLVEADRLLLDMGRSEILLTRAS